MDYKIMQERFARIEEAIAEIRRISKALSVLGIPAGDNLNWISTMLHENLEQLQKDIGKSISESFQASIEASANMLKAGLAVAQIKSQAGI
jgi:hypothetical protein